MNALADLLGLLFAPFDPVVLHELIRAVPLLLASFDPVFLAIFVIPICRFFVPDLCIWIAHTVRRIRDGTRRTRLAPARTPLVSIVIAGRNEAEEIGNTLRSVLGCGYPNLEIIYVDDGSDDGTVQAARRVAQAAGGAKIRVFSAPRRNGKPSALNIGIALARGEFIAIIDADCDLQYGSIQNWLLPFADPRMGAVCGQSARSQQPGFVADAPAGMRVRAQHHPLAAVALARRLPVDRARGRRHVPGRDPQGSGRVRHRPGRRHRT